jgi:hypothetical protein
LETALRRLVAVVLSWVLLPGAPAWSQAFPAEETQQMEAGRSALAQGAAQLNQLQFAAAADSLREGVAELESAFVLLPDFHEILDGYLKLAAAYARLDREGESDKAMLAVVRLAPSLDLEPGAYPAVFIRHFHAVRRRAQTGPKGSVRVTSPRPARVRLDGRDSGETPLELGGLVPGPHFLVASFVGTPSRVAEGYRVAVQAGQVAEVRVPEHGDLEGLKGMGEAARGPDSAILAEPVAATSALAAAPPEEKKKNNTPVVLIVGLTVLAAAAAIVGGYLAANAANASPVGKPQVSWSPP